MANEITRILRCEGPLAMGFSHYLLTDFTQRVMSPQEAESIGWWVHGKHAVPSQAYAAAVYGTENEALRLRVRQLEHLLDGWVNHGHSRKREADTFAILEKK